MGRAGSGGHSGGHSSGGHSFSHSSGGHHVSSSRAGSSRSSSFWGNSRSSSRSGGSFNYINIGNRNYGGNGYGEFNPINLNKILIGIAAFVLIFFVLIPAIAQYKSSPKSTINREKITGYSYVNDSIKDDIGWFDNETKTEKELKRFFDKTGVQPMIYLKKFDYSLKSDEQKEAWAKEYFDKMGYNENTFLFVYFGEADVDNDVGYMVYVNGLETGSVMDSEAVSIFWNYIDRYWYSDMSTDDLFVTVFDKTGDTIMRISATGIDAFIWFIKVVIVVSIILGIIIIMNKKRKHEREKAEETEKLLNTPINEIKNPEVEDLVDKYNNKEE